MRIVLDSSAVIAWLFAEPGNEIVDGYLDDKHAVIYMHALATTEVYYYLLRKGLSRPEAWSGCVPKRVAVIDDAGGDFCSRVGDLKYAAQYLSLADSFVAVLAERLNAKLVTSDRGFAKAADSINAKIELIR